MTARQKRGIRHLVQAIFGRVKVLFRPTPKARRTPCWYAEQTGEDYQFLVFASRKDRDTWVGSGPYRRIVRGNERPARKARKEAIHG